MENDSRIEVLRTTEVRALSGEGRLASIGLEHTPTGDRRTVPCSGLFCFIGAQPATEWLEGRVALDPDGFVLTDRQLPEAVLHSSFAGRDPFPFETSVMGVFGRRRPARVHEAGGRRGWRGIECRAIRARPPGH